MSSQAALHAVRADHEVKDWDSVRDNDNGQLNVLENLETALTSGSHDDFLRTLAKIDTRLGGEGYFAPKFVQSNLPELLVGMLASKSNPDLGRGGESKSGANDWERVAAVIARGCKRHTLVQDKFARDFFPEILESLIFQPNEDLYSIIESMSTSSKWLKFLGQQTKLIDHLASPSVQRFSVLERLPQASISKGVVELSLAAAVEQRDVAHTAAALRCLQAMTFYPFGREEALRLDGISIIIELIRSRETSSTVKAPAAGCLTNLLQDPTHKSKKEAVAIGVPDALLQLLDAPNYEKDRVAKDQVLFALQAISILSTEPAARKLFQEPKRSRQVEKMSSSGCKLVARTAKESHKVIQWMP